MLPMWGPVQKWSPKTKPKPKEIEPSSCHQTIRKFAILALFFENWTSNLFCSSFVTLILMGNTIMKSIGPNLAIYPINTSNTKMAISQNTITILPKLQSPKTCLVLWFLRYSNSFFASCLQCLGHLFSLEIFFQKAHCGWWGCHFPICP